MHPAFPRRDLWKLAPLGLAMPQSLAAATQPAPATDTFPVQQAAVVREMVTVSHGNLKRVRELVEARPALAKATWDWGFGDWESALGAASHTGSREIAELLIANGARPTLFSATMLGQLEVVKAFVAAQPGCQRIPGPHSISLLSHAKNGGPAAEPVLRYLESLGDAGSPATVPLTETEIAALTGTYTFGSGLNDRIEVTAIKGQLIFTRTGAVGRGLLHLGDHTFHPAGASAVRISFTDGGLTVHDAEVVVTARK
jgi:hypothetical protein